MQLSPFEVTRRVNSATPLLFQNLARGSRFPSVIVTVTSHGHRIGIVFGGVVLISGLANFWTTKPSLYRCINCPKWAEQVQEWKDGKIDKIAIWPYPNLGWFVQLPPRKPSSQRRVDGREPRRKRPLPGRRQGRRAADLAGPQQVFQRARVLDESARGQCHAIDLAKHRFRCKAVPVR